MNRKTTAEFRDDLEDFDNCMLVTRDGKVLRSRPMRPYIGHPDGGIRFITSRDAHKIDEAEREPQANLVFADHAGMWISVSGSLRISNDLAEVDDLWSDEAAPWFKNGKKDAVVLIFSPQMAEYWSVSHPDQQAGWQGGDSESGKPVAEEGKLSL